MDVFKLDTPSNISEMSEEEILKLCSSFGNVKSVKTRAKIVKLIYKDILKFDLSKDLFYVLVDEPKECLVIAPAGGGKTTTMAVKAALVKAYRGTKFTNSGKVPGDRILSLVYTKDNVKDVIDRHTEVVSKLNALEIPALTLDYNLNCSTMHSFCYKWIIKEPNYRSKLDLIGCEMFDEVSQLATIDSIVAKICKKKEIELPRQFKASSFISLYNYMAETYSSLEDLANSNIFLDLGLPAEIVADLIKRYEKRKKLIRKVDQTDLLTYFIKLMNEHEDARIRIQEYYDYIIADEVQDFTPILKDILKAIVGEHTVLSCIGDDDQAIYGFRGADYRNALNFKEIFPSAKVLSLATNRRCPSNVLSMANSVIRLNKTRYDKVMTGIKGPGNISFNGYNDRIGQYMAIVSLLKTLGHEEMKKTIIASRENLFSLPLSILMYRANLDFYTTKGYGPFDYGLFNAITQVMSAITSGGSKRALVNLYRALPISKKEMCEALKYDPVKGEFLDGKSYVDFDKIDFEPSRLNNPKFVTIYKNLIRLHRNHEMMPCREYMPGLIQIIKKYYWDFLSKNSKMPLEITEFCEDFCLDVFNTSKTYKEKLAEVLQFKERISKNLENRNGVMLSAFHSMKGLEADNIILCDLAESIFPNFSGIDFRPYDEQTKQDLKEEETRLCYVALTRTKKNLWLFYSKHDPSYYISFLMDSSTHNAEQSASVYSEVDETPVTLSRFTPSSLFGEDSSFIMSEEKKTTEEPSADDVEEIDLEIEEIDEINNSNKVEIVSDSSEINSIEESVNQVHEYQGLVNEDVVEPSSRVVLNDSVDSEFIESGEVSISKEHKLDGVSVVAKSIKDSYRSNVFNSVFNRFK